ncbi:NAD(P)-binding protein [Mycena sanguinolenta]|uniref:NAD(P)-binding protein n=1 Tax=Mycena sanguinolenta TaxID=230812 RepID=A0A8H6YB31_9AGAR|nr:NAD(P)-binding protein [Mycena sanguinolenta]
MTISQDPSAPLVVLVGITGLQGGSVARALIDSDKPYRIRGLTRDANKPAARTFAAQGVQIVSVSLTVDNAANVRKAFDGADIAFAVTNFNEHMDKQREISEGKMLVDTAKAAGVKLFIWSGLESLSALSGGKFSRVGFFDAKREVTEYAKDSGVPTSVVEAGYYATNIFEAPYALKKQPDGSYVFGMPVPANTQVPVIDVAHDYGLYVRAAIENPALGPGSEVLSGKLISFGELVETLSQVSVKKITYLELDREAFIEATGMPDYGPMLSDMFEAFAIHGYYGGKAIAAESLLPRKPRSWSDFLAATPVQDFFH